MAASTSLCGSAALLSRLVSHSHAGCSALAAQVGSRRAFVKKPLAGKGGGDSVWKKKGDPRDGPKEDGPHLQPLVALLSSPARTELPLSPGEQARADAYRSQQTAEYHAWIKDMTIKHKLQRAALQALPERLRVLAAQPDHTPFPPNRKYYYDTPPESYRDVPAGAGQRADAAAASQQGSR
ncbi:hypothetical protein TSOC_012092 [Tetrabaena socialis]|uniref:Uncharacterized protein n=1 Tax=Tetrabaena socialis TaxID=47790 RepID=A0A2J7ZNY3_9CHLO|nr:hypothetical protein TSOC_012092 [Tetrabaena socialis]|eukprot:PNH01972.1 hypothetical protein TSOC_012092 [Tetrabaena socialis]